MTATSLGQSASRIFSLNDRLNQLLLEHLHPAAWTAPPPPRTRTIAAIFTHMHNVRTKWIRLSAPHLKLPPQLHRAHCTPRQARVALAQSAALCSALLADALGAPPHRVHKFCRDGWAPAWFAGPEMLCYMLAHEAHHRGQVCMLAHQLGFPLPSKVNHGLWNWERLQKDLRPPRRPSKL